jgi:DNA-binding MarR family transcriptional regulator
MPDTDLYSDANKLADLTFHILTRYREKEIRFAAKNNLTQGEFRCLKFLGDNACLNNKQIAERMRVTPGRMTRIVDSLVDKKYVNREIDPADRRNMMLTLTESGVSMVQKLNSAYINVHRDILSDIDKQQQKPLLNAMDNLLSALK